MTKGNRSNHRIAKPRRQNLDLICSLAHAKPQLPENFLSKDWAGLRSLMARSKFLKFWLNFALKSLLANFVGPAGGDPNLAVGDAALWQGGAHG